MFFGLTNSPATFQAMINNILRDLIDIGDVAVFMDNMLVEIKDENKHNEVVEKILRKMKANNLYLKPEKSVQKVKEIDFLELVMGAKSIKKRYRKRRYQEFQNGQGLRQLKIYRSSQDQQITTGNL